MFFQKSLPSLVGVCPKLKSQIDHRSPSCHVFQQHSQQCFSMQIWFAWWLFVKELITCHGSQAFWILTVTFLRVMFERFNVEFQPCFLCLCPSSQFCVLEHHQFSKTLENSLLVSPYKRHVQTLDTATLWFMLQRLDQEGLQFSLFVSHMELLWWSLQNPENRFDGGGAGRSAGNSGKSGNYSGTAEKNLVRADGWNWLGGLGGWCRHGKTTMFCGLRDFMPPSPLLQRMYQRLCIVTWVQNCHMLPSHLQVNSHNLSMAEFIQFRGLMIGYLDHFGLQVCLNTQLSLYMPVIHRETHI